MFYAGCELIGFGAGSSGYVTQAVTFDGTNDYLSRGAELTGNVDGKKGIVSFWIRINGGDGAIRLVAENGGSQLFQVAMLASNKFRIQGYTSGVSLILELVSNTAYTAGATWRHFLASWDLAVGAGHLYINSVDDKASGATLTNNTLDYTNGDIFIGARSGGTNKLNADLADVYINLAEYLDFSVAGNREKFINGGKPVDLGSSGATPTGTQPIIFLKGTVAGGFSTNKGSGGGFTTTGTLTDASGSPSD